ncbi:sulfotransferase family protein [Alteraurantiacibacter buctensis]|uniref:Sulfotransferase family protein n=1 Tax=Alteraurantiacibacter buctensis TaxID=1503981 RepID=A0A844YWV3_9SPHN|nr:sulfotransferase family protein [Alteraurantiacibacter buctensis]MXO71612.1 sulfotransferase family protein [Alteraurantiacibacter buctensis]
MALQVIGAAMPRTGTLSLKFALELLGFGPCYHMTEFIQHPEHRWKWAFAKLRPGLLDPLWDTYQATVDSPGCMMWRQLAQRFPQAKVILTRRDPDAWFDSVRETVGDPGHVKVMMRSPLAPGMLAQNPFGTKLDREAMTARFEQYGEAVKATIPAERLLVFEARDGWEPLCAFLGVPVPEIPYPRVNEREAMQQASGELQGNPMQQSFPVLQQHVRAYMEAQRQRLMAR